MTRKAQMTAKRMTTSPIGIFDSGIGGLTVAKEVSNILPQQPIIYFGDTAHLPYGDKSAESIRQYSARISDFLLGKGCKVIIIACNTASSLAFSQTLKYVNGRAEVFNVIDPVVNYVTTNYRNVGIGVIGTKATINSRIYAKRICRNNRSLQVSSLATPLLAPMIEEGYFNNYISQTIINSYLSKKSLTKIKAIILACTHYPLIKKEVETYYAGKVDVIDSASIVAKHVRDKLSQKSKAKSQKSKVHAHSFYVSDYTVAFEKSTRIFFGKGIQLKEVRIWDRGFGINDADIPKTIQGRFSKTGCAKSGAADG